MSNTVMYVNPNQAMFYENGYPADVASLFVVTGTSTRVEHLNVLGFVDIVYEGTGFTISGGSLSGGTITTFTGYKDAAPHSTDFITSGLNTPVSGWLGFASSNDGLGLMKYIYGGDDIISNDGNNCPSIIAGYGGNDTIIGGILNDTAEYLGARSEYTIQQNSNGSYSIVDTISNRDGTDTLTNIERLQFADTKIALDSNGNAGTTAKILGAVFGTSSLTNTTYVGIGLTYLDGGMSYADLMALAINAAGATTNDAIVNLLWTNLFGVAPTAAEAAPYVAMLDSGSFTAGTLGVLAADTSYNTTNINLAGLAQTGIEFI